MFSFNHRREDAREALAHEEGAGGLEQQEQATNFAGQLPPVEQLPFPAQQPFTAGVDLLPKQQPSSGATSSFDGPISSFPGLAGFGDAFTNNPDVTRNLPEAQPGQLNPVTPIPPFANVQPLVPGTASARPPLLIMAQNKRIKPDLAPAPAKRPRRLSVHLAVLVLVLLIVTVTLLTVLPESADGTRGFNPLGSIMNLQHDNNVNTSLVAQQAATVTAVTQDGFDKGPVNYTGLPTPPPGVGGGGSGSLNRFAYGQCTYYANMRYHALTGHWITWLGNANQWVGGASASGWVVSSKPRVPSIIVLMAGVQGAGSFGHVAVVERINSDGSVYTSNYNWFNGGGGWNTLSYWTFHPGGGVYFIWHP